MVLDNGPFPFNDAPLESDRGAARSAAQAVGALLAGEEPARGGHQAQDDPRRAAVLVQEPQNPAADRGGHRKALKI